MIEAHIVEVVVMVQAGDVVPNNEPFKIKQSSKASEVKNEAIGEDLHLDMKITRTSSATTVKNLDTMLQITGTELKILPIQPKQQLGNNSTLLLTHDDSSIQNDVQRSDSNEKSMLIR